MPELWFEPIQYAPDHLALFTNPEAWARARVGLTGVRLYVQNTTSYQFQDLIRIGAFKTIKDLGLQFSVETGAVKPWLCNGKQMAELHLLPAIDAILKSGGTVDKIVAEEPFYDGTIRDGACLWTMPQAADQLVAWVAALKAHYPDIPICDAEPYPALSASQLLEWINALVARGFTPQTFLLDVDMQWVRDHGVDLTNDLKALVSVLTTHGIRFGTYLTANENWNPPNDEAWGLGALAYLTRILHDLPGIPDLVLSSWHTDPPQPSHNLPETTDWTFTNLLLRVEAVLAPPLPPPAPIPLGWDFNLTKQAAGTTGGPGDQNYYAVEPVGKRWLLVVESEDRPKHSCPGPLNRSYPINGPGSPVTLFWLAHSGDLGTNWTANMKVDHVTAPSPCGPGFFTFFGMMDNADGGGPLPPPRSLRASHTLYYDQWAPPGDNEMRLLVGAQAFWDGESHILEVDLIESGWADRDPDPRLVFKAPDWYGDGSAEYVVLAGQALGLGVERGKVQPVWVNWADLFTLAIAQGWLKAPSGPQATQAVYIGVEVKNCGVANLWHTDFRIYGV